MNYRKFIPYLVLSTLVLTSAKARADERAIGIISNLIVNNSSSDNASYQLGSVTVGGQLIHWGGSICPNIALPTTTQIDLLTTAAINKKQVTLFNKNGCLTGVWVDF